MPFVWRKILPGWRCWRRCWAWSERPSGPAAAAATFGRSAPDPIASLLLSPMVELHHLVLAVPAVFLLVVKAFFDSAWSVRPAILGLGAFVVCLQAAVRCDETKLLHFVALGILLILLCLAMCRPGDVQT